LKLTRYITFYNLENKIEGIKLKQRIKIYQLMLTMTTIETNDNEQYVITISLNELVAIILAIYYTYNFMIFLRSNILK
jgi:hypothetical protein